MKAKGVHTFLLRAAIGPEDVFRLLRKVCDHENQKCHEPEFDFNWIGRRITLSASSAEGVNECTDKFLEQIVKVGGGEDSFLAGPVKESGGRFVRPVGVALMDAATFGELIGRSLVDVGLRQVRVVDSTGGCLIEVTKNAIAERIDYRELMAEFPLPSYITLEDKGIAVSDTGSDTPGKKTKRR